MGLNEEERKKRLMRRADLWLAKYIRFGTRTMRFDIFTTIEILMLMCVNTLEAMVGFDRTRERVNKIINALEARRSERVET